METTETPPMSSTNKSRLNHERYVLVRDWLLGATKRAQASSLVRGLEVWGILLGLAYLVGTLAIAPMIGEAAGLKPGVYSLPPNAASSKTHVESTVQITPVSDRKLKPSATMAAEPVKEKPRRKRRRRHASLPPDQVFLGRSESRVSGDSESGSERRSRRHHREKPENRTDDREEPQRIGNGGSGLD